MNISHLSNIQNMFDEVVAQNKDWAYIYDGGKDQNGYMLLEDLEPDIVEDELLEDD